MKLFSWTFIFILLSISVAQGATTLKKLQHLALTNRKVIDKYKANLEKQNKNVTLARSGFYPSVDVSYSARQLNKATPFEDKDNSVATGAVTWNLFAGLSDMYGVKSAKLLRDAENYKLKGIAQDIQLNVALRYLTIFDRQASLQVATDSYNTLMKIYKDTEYRFNVGVINKNELLKIKVELDNAEISFKKAQADLTKSRRLLEREVGKDVLEENLDFLEFSQPPPMTVFHEYEQKMLLQRSEIKVLEEMVLAAEANEKAERGRLYPRVDVTSSYTKNDPGYSFGPDIYDEEVRHQLTVSMNLFDGFGNTSRIKKAKLEARTAKDDLDELKNDLKTELKNLFSDYEVSKDNVVVAKSSIAQAEENLRITRLSHKNGLSTTSDLLDAITNLSRAKYNLVVANSELFANYFKINRTVDGF